MKIPRYLLVGIALAAVGLIALIFLSLTNSKRPEKTSETLRTASDLLAVQQAMGRDHLSGFLPGNHARLPDRLRRKKFTSVSIMPSLIIGSHSISVGGFKVGTHLVLLKDGPSNSWTVSQDVQLGSRSWKTPVGTLKDAEAEVRVPN
ncbi:MAG: hypothetical protein JNK85_02710 [Verrucomicrobiales bacterium]|nr:hypothetical protein [Verrucomicrobiales bacterium]